MWKRALFVSLVIGVLITVLALAPCAATRGAGQELQPDWSRLKIVTYPSGLTGFFDPATGKLYVYDSNVERCLMVRQLDRLGAPLKNVKN
jgi:hypothetical protein